MFSQPVLNPNGLLPCDGLPWTTARTCANCGKPTQVPFLPTGSRPVYCADCFQTVRR